MYKGIQLHGDIHSENDYGCVQNYLHTVLNGKMLKGKTNKQKKSD